MGCLSKAAKEVLSLGPAMTGADDQLRMTEKLGVLSVTKFAAPSPLKEIVYRWEVGARRVLEVTFR